VQRCFPVVHFFVIPFSFFPLSVIFISFSYISSVTTSNFFTFFPFIFFIFLSLFNILFHCPFLYFMFPPFVLHSSQSPMYSNNISRWAVSYLIRLIAGFNRGGLVSIPEQVVLDLLRTMHHCCRFSPGTSVSPTNFHSTVHDHPTIDTV
jgi:hypothetical protein